MTVTGAIRFLVGAALVAAGGTLVAPVARKMADAVATPGPAGGHGGDQRTLSVAQPGPVVPAPASQPAAVTVPPAPGHGVGAPHGDPWFVTPDSAGGLQLDRAPPPPPGPLPPAPLELQQANPAIGAAYRSTLDVPPPPLLDVAGPPPTVSWATPVPAPAAPSRVEAAPEVTVPAIYRVVDGDDLGTIAARFYGHPAAASAIWAANRDAIPQPDVLPIGAELRLPPPWAVRTHQRGASGAIEPVSYARPVAAESGGATPAVSGGPWLAPLQAPNATPTPSQVPAAASPSPAPATTSVRVGPGETLASLAGRLYGDPAMAHAIFAANRDRLRGPELLVPGMELRLPRPVSVSRP